MELLRICGLPPDTGLSSVLFEAERIHSLQRPTSFSLFWDPHPVSSVHYTPLLQGVLSDIGWVGVDKY